MKFLKKMDEMELFISQKSLKIAYTFTIIFLFIWTIFDYSHGKTSSTAGLLLLSQNLILLFFQYYYKKKLS